MFQIYINEILYSDKKETKIIRNISSFQLIERSIVCFFLLVDDS